MLDGSEYVFVEVKYRSSTKYGHPLDFITPKKLNKIIKTVDYFFNHYQIQNPSYRIDAVSITHKELPLHLQNITQ